MSRRFILILGIGTLLWAIALSGCSRAMSRHRLLNELGGESFGNSLILSGFGDWTDVVLDRVDANANIWINRKDGRRYQVRFRGVNRIFRTEDGMSGRTRMRGGNPTEGETLLGIFDYFGLPYSENKGIEVWVYGKDVGLGDGRIPVLPQPAPVKQWFTHLGGGAFRSPLTTFSGVTLERIGAHTDLWRNLEDGRVYRVRFNAVHFLFRQVDGSLIRTTEHEGVSVEAVGPLEKETLLGKVDHLDQTHSGERGYEVWVYGTPISNP